MRRGSTLLVVALLVAACSSAATKNIQETASPSIGASGTAAVATTDTGRPTEKSPAPTSRSTSTAATAPTESPTPEPTRGDANVVKVSETVKAWASSGAYVRYQVIIKVQNTGSGWADMIAGDSDYTVYDKAGDVTATGSFLYAYPRYLAPGATGYLLEESVEDSVKADAFVKVEASGQYKSIDEPGPLLTTDKVKLKAEAYTNEVVANGTVTNKGSVDVEDAVVGVVFFDAKGNPIGFTYTNLVENLAAGKTKGFSTTGFATVKLSAVKSFAAFASSMDY